MELIDVMTALRRNRVSAAVAFALAVLLGVAAAYLPAERYRSTATVLVQPNPDKAAIGAVQMVQFVMPSLAASVESRTFGEAARAQLPPAVSAAKPRVESEGDPGTGILTIRAESTRRAATAPTANAYARHLIANPPAAELITLTVLDPARPPASPAAPAKKPIMLGSVVLGLIAAVFAAVATDSIRRRLDGVDEIRNRFGTIVLGEIPRLPGRLRGNTSPELVFAGDHPAIVDGVQYLRTNLGLLLSDSKYRSVAVTSVMAGEGKSTVAANLAWAMASGGRRCTLVDADLRRPSLHLRFGHPLDPGLATARQGGLPGVLRETAMAQLRVLPAGTPERHPAEIIRMAVPALLQQPELSDDLLLFDCPPLTGVAETTLISTIAGAVVLVVDARRRRLVDLDRAIGELREKGAEVLGVVINRSRRPRSWRPAGYYLAHAPKRVEETGSPEPVPMSVPATWRE